MNNLGSIFLFAITIFVFSTVKAQSDIKINGVKVNRLDTKKRKQGDWIFFDKLGNIQLSCLFQNDICTGPIIFYENSDTAFVRLPATDSVEPFILYKGKKKYYGNFIHTSDSTSRIEIEPDPLLNNNIILEIKKYQYFSLEPVYFFSQKKIIDYISANFISSRFIFNKPLYILLTISGSGLISNVEFPRNKNNLSGDEEKELHWIYSTMPRWQPFFYKNKVRQTRVMLSNNSTLSVLSFDR